VRNSLSAYGMFFKFIELLVSSLRKTAFQAENDGYRGYIKDRLKFLGEWEEMEHKGVGEQLAFRRVRRFWDTPPSSSC